MKSHLLCLAIAATIGVHAAPSTLSAPIALTGHEKPLSVIALSEPNSNGQADLYISGYIGDDWYGPSSTAQGVIDKLATMSATVINVWINSQGGSVPDGLAIHNALRMHPARVIVTVIGQACSIASLIVQAGDERIMAANTLQMIHAPSTYVGGNAIQLREYANQLETWARAVLTSYVARSPKKAAELEAALTDGADHYYLADECVALGIADRVLEIPVVKVDEAAAAAALTGYVVAIAKTPAPVTACLRKQIQSAASPQVFASLPETTQRAVYAQIEDPTMRQQLHAIMASGVAAAAAGAAALPTPPAAPAAPGAVTPPPTPAVAAAPPQPAAPTPAAAAAAANPDDPIAALVARNEAIRNAFAGFRQMQGIAALESECLADPRLTIEAVQQRLLARVGAGGQPLNGGGGGGDVHAGADEVDRLRDAGVNMILARASLLPHAEAERVRQGNPFLNASLIDMAERSLIRAGMNTRSMSREQIAMHVLAAQTTSDFPLLLTSTLHKVLQIGYRLVPFTWSRFCAVGSLSDYRPHPRYHVSSFSDLKDVNEAGEYEEGVLGDGEKESIQGARKGRLLTVTPEVLINDDLGAFTKPVLTLGQAAGRTIEKAVFTTLGANSGFGPTMSDGNPLFHASHNNIAPVAAAPTTASWDAARQQLGAQMDPGGNDYLDIVPAIWLGPQSLGTAARNVNTAEFDQSVSSKYAPPNTSRGMVRDVVDTPRLSSTPWYMLADPNIEPVLEVAFLDGVQTPTIDQQNNFKTDGITYKVVHRFGVGGVGWRGGVRNAGA